MRSKNRYRIITDGKFFRIELYQTWTYRGGFLFLRKITQEQWVPCDRLGDDACDDDGVLDPFEIASYSTIEAAESAIAEWQTEYKTPTWKVVSSQKP